MSDMKQDQPRTVSRIRRLSLDIWIRARRLGVGRATALGLLVGWGALLVAMRCGFLGAPAFAGETSQCVTPSTTQVYLCTQESTTVTFTAQPCATAPSAKAECTLTGSEIDHPTTQVAVGPYTSGGTHSITSPVQNEIFHYVPTTQNANCPDKTVPLPTTQIAVNVIELSLTAVAETSSPLPPGVLCTNAQAACKKARWKISIVPSSATATVALDSSSEASDVSVSSGTLSDGQEFDVTGAAKTGKYKLVATATQAACTATAEGTAFKFVPAVTTYVGSGTPSGTGWTGGGTKSKNEISFLFPSGPGAGATTHGSGSRSFTSTIKVDVLPAGSFNGNVAADIDVFAVPSGEVGAIGILGFTISGINVSPLHAEASCISTVAIIASGSQPVTTSTDVSAPFAGLGIIDQKIITGTVHASQTAVTLSGASFPKTVNAETTASFTATTTSYNLGAFGIWQSHARTIVDKDFILDKDVETVGNFRIVP